MTLQTISFFSHSISLKVTPKYPGLNSYVYVYICREKFDFAPITIEFSTVWGKFLVIALFQCFEQKQRIK